ncbi:hypothetical protein INT47_002198 [Mucor saturninus]|uniref:VPS9 domain-containing protein n=1 Tax=Mucor saturninus TaxID=64648 RepID=A0A8H7V8I3_9FUNG|nr:hypothetical protein INT47_002198 [Mucor saturninus]
MVKTIALNNSKEIISKIDKLVLEFCDTSKSFLDRLKGTTQQQRKFSIKIRTSILMTKKKSYIMDSTYDVAFFKITQFLLDHDKKLTLALEEMEHLDFSQIGLPTSITDQRNRVHAAISEFERIGSFRTPAEKLDCLLNTVSELTRDPSAYTATFLDSDSLIPLLLITLIRSKVPHLTANLIYMKEYTFERNIVTGKYGYALSTFEGVLEYILDAHAELSDISRQNVQYWSAIKTGDLDQVIRYDTSDAHDTRDAYGNNALMIACIHHQYDIVNYLLSMPVKGAMTNDMNSTPLMLAIHYGKSFEIVKLLLTHPHVIQSVNEAVDNYGNTAILYACAIDNLDILKALLQVAGHQTLLDQHRNTLTGDTVLHVASRNKCSIEFMTFLLSLCPQRNYKNKNMETFYHACRDVQVLKWVLHNENDMHDLIRDVDEKGRSPLMTWALAGRLDMIELVTERTRDGNAIVDHDGNTLLHLLAMHTGKGLTLGDKSLDYMVEQFNISVNVRDWVHGNTPLHITAETSVLASAQSINNAVILIRALVKHGAVLDAVNYRDEHPATICKIPELAMCLDELHLVKHTLFSPAKKTSMYHYAWHITRPCFELNNGQTDLYYVIKSGQMGKPETMRTVKRSLDDFTFLRQELLYEMPETFLPTFQNLQDPLLIDLKPPPLAWIDLTMTRLQSFMDWLQYHPVLRYHDLVISFVRSMSDLQPTLIRDNSFSRRKLLLEKISDLPLPHSVTNTLDEEYFLTYAQEMMIPLKSGFLHLLTTARRIMDTQRELQTEMGTVAHNSLCLKTSVLITPLAIETIRICANITGDQSYVSPWPQLIKVSQMAYDMIDGILLSLQRPFSLLNQRNLLRENIEQQKEILCKSKHWHTMFTPKKHVEKDKDKMIENMNELNYIDGQITQSHKMISDELAHFQSIHPRQMIQTMQSISRSRLIMEKQKLLVLEQTLYQWENVQ